jgi:hypothetical protein
MKTNTSRFERSRRITMKQPSSPSPSSLRPVTARPRERGAVMVTVLLVMLGLLALGITGLWLTSGNLQISAHTNLRNQALYVAEAGIEAVRADLNTGRNMTELLTGGRDSNDNVPTGVDANGNPNGIGAVYFYSSGTVLRDVPFPPAGFKRGEGSTATAPISNTMGTYTVWIRNDTGELRRGQPLIDGNGTFVIRSRGVAVDGRIEVVLEATLSPDATEGRTGRVCYSGKNACDGNSSTISGIVVQ